MTIAQLKAYIKYDFKRTDKDTEMLQAINDAIVDISTRMPHGAYKYQSYLPCVASQEDYPLPSTIIHLLHPVKLLEGSGTNDEGYPMERISKEEYDVLEINPNRTSPPTGQPTKYCIYSGSILLSPVPDVSTYLLELDWTKRPTVLTADGESPALGAEYDEVIKQMVMARLMRSIELYQEADYWRGMYEDPYGNAVGLLQRLLDIERDKEIIAIGQVENNDL
jgi:hypothetical protein